MKELKSCGFFQSVPKTAPLSYEEEREYIKKIKKGDKEAKDKFVRLKISSVVRLAYLYKGRGVDVEDLMLEGTIGLLKALEKYDLRKRVRFISYAVWWIKHYILRTIYDGAKSIRIPIKKQLDKSAIRGMEEELSKLFGRLPTTEEISRALGISVKDVEEAMDLAESAISLDTLIGEKTTIGDIMGTDMEILENNALMSVYVSEIKENIDKLNKVERTIIRLRFGLGGGAAYTLQQVGSILNLSRERIRQIEKRAIIKLRRALG
ncbi:MAG: RNA polymerase sigma factor RpoD/SigA [bacterium]